MLLDDRWSLLFMQGWDARKLHYVCQKIRLLFMLLCIYNFGEHIGISKRTPFLHRFLARCTSKASDNLVQGTKHLISFPVEYQILIICKAANIKSRHFGSLNTVRNQYAIFNCFSSFQYTWELYLFSVSAIDTTEIIFSPNSVQKNK